MKNESINVLLEDVSGIKCKYDEISKNTGSHFNVFEVINLRTDEVRLHSRFLAELLNPQGTHGQEDVFLDLFVKQVGITDFESKGASVSIEESIGVVTETTGGRLDIYIKDKKDNAIVIENKINARDQENQLVRYNSFLKSNHRKSLANLLYLNLYGCEPSEFSCGDLKEGKDFSIISYKDDIVEWLSKCIEVISNLPLLREGIVHYLNLIKSLTGTSINEAMDKELVDNILSDAKKVNSAFHVSASIVEVKIQLQLRFWQKLLDKFKLEGINVDKSNIDDEVVRDFYFLKEKVYPSLFINVKQSGNLQLRFGIELEESVYFGFRVERNGVGGISNEKMFCGLVNKVSSIDNKYKSCVWWLGYQYFEPDLNFKLFNSETMFGLGDDASMNELVDSLVKRSLSDISQMKNMLGDEPLL